MLKTAPFMLALLAVVFTIAFPTPDDFMRVEAILPSPNMSGLEETRSAPSPITLAGDTPVAPFISRIEESGCLDKLALLPKPMIDNCSQLVADAVIEIAEYELADADNLTTQSGLLVERLRLAAANVCRARWVTEPGLTFDNNDPVCAVSTIDLASAN